MSQDVTADVGADIGLVLGPEASARAPIGNAPILSRAGGAWLRTIEIVDNYGDHRLVATPVERPLSVRVDDRAVGMLWTLGTCAEWLVLGYLWNQGLVGDVASLESISIDWPAGIAAVRTRDRARPADGSAPAQRPDARALGSDARGVLKSGEARDLAARPRPRISRTTLLALLEQAPRNDGIYRAAGSVHGCGLFRGAELWIYVEDVSRRNAIDTVAGWMALHGISGGEQTLFSTGRLSAEIILKAARMGVATIVSRKGITGSCLDLAADFGMTLIGHAARDRYICYAGQQHFDADS